MGPDFASLTTSTDGLMCVPVPTLAATTTIAEPVVVVLLMITTVLLCRSAS